MRKLIFVIVILLSSISDTYADPTVRQNMKEPDSDISVLMLDMDRDGRIKLSPDNKKGSVYWDIDLDGMAEAVGWVNPNDAILVIDNNGDSNIPNQSELFGSKSEDGFAVLSAFDLNQDKKITPEDEVWAKLYLWFDKNTDGYSQNGELYSLDDYRIQSISLNTEQYNEPLGAGQRISASSDVVVDAVNADSANLKIYNVLPIFDNVNTTYNQDYKLDVRALFMPTLRGYGTIPDLHIAISNDEELLNMVKDLAVMDLDIAFSPDTPLEEYFEEMLFRWSNVQDIPYDSRGPNMNAQRLAFLEALMDKPFIQTAAGGTPNPLPAAASILKSAYKDAFQGLFPRFMIQAHGNQLFTNKVQYNPISDMITGTAKLNYDTLEILRQKAEKTSPDRAVLLWVRYVRILNWRNNISQMEDECIQKLSAAISSTIPDKSFESILFTVNNSYGARAHDLPERERENNPYQKYIARYIDYVLLGLFVALLLLIAFNNNNLFKNREN